MYFNAVVTSQVSNGVPVKWPLVCVPLGIMLDLIGARTQAEEAQFIKLLLDYILDDISNHRDPLGLRTRDVAVSLHGEYLLRCHCGEKIQITEIELSSCHGGVEIARSIAELYCVQSRGLLEYDGCNPDAALITKPLRDEMIVRQAEKFDIAC
jgi:hypothetical protein